MSAGKGEGEREGKLMIAICQNCGGEVSTKLEGAKVANCYRPECAYGEGE